MLTLASDMRGEQWRPSAGLFVLHVRPFSGTWANIHMTCLEAFHMQSIQCLLHTLWVAVAAPRQIRLITTVFGPHKVPLKLFDLQQDERSIDKTHKSTIHA